MKKARWIRMIPVVMAGVMISTNGWGHDKKPGSPMSPPSTCAPAHQGGGMMPGMMGKMMQGMMPGMRQGMHGMGGGPMGMKGMMWGMRGMMRSFHTWIGKLMSNSKNLGLSTEQINRLEEAVTEHLKRAILNRAEARALQVDLMQALRKKTVDLQSVEVLLKKIVDHDFQLQMDGIRLYTRMLQVLTAEQRAKAEEVIGTPFPPFWEVMSMGPGMGMPGMAPMKGKPPSSTPKVKEKKAEGHHNPPGR